MAREQGRTIVAQNKKARHDYHIDDTYEAGLVLVGTEVKSLRLGRASLVDGFADIDGGEAWLRNVHIPEYSQGAWTDHDRASQAQAAAARQRDRQDPAPDHREGLHAGAAGAVLQGRARQGRDRGRPRQEAVRQAPHARRPYAEREKQQALGRRLRG